MLRERFARQLDELREDLIRLSSMVEHALSKAIKSLETWDIATATQITHDDAHIDAIQHSVEDKVILLLATQQPVARDLRLITTIIAIAGELERIGDYANTIARRVRRLTTRPVLLPPPSRLGDMALLAQKMLRSSLDAFLNQDTALAQSLGQFDEQVDALENSLRAELLALGRSTPQTIEAMVDMLDIVHALERVADRATNIAERVIYLTTSTFEELNP